MKLFSKKGEDAKPELPPLKFPEFPKEEPKVPSYEGGISPAEAASLKEAIQPRLEIPIRKPIMRHAATPMMERQPVEERSYEEPEERETQKRGQTLFVKIERYKEAVAKMEHIKEKITEAEKVLSKLDEMKRQEDEELMRWHEDLETIKTKILSVDRSLFEGGP
ncbi:MAG: hypothetical protein Q8O03_03260 [Nanoarchaeota archaeon]|nr:hypothetical protein [Nanoarchaeota archaeon]